MVGGLLPLTTIDFPGKLASVIFLKGCNLRCSYCHNPGLLDSSEEDTITWDQIFSFLHRRKGFLEGVVLSGGEPLFHPNIFEIIEEIRSMNFEVALHTNGSFTEKLEQILEKRTVSFVAMDIKAPFDEYHLISKQGNGLPVKRSAALLAQSMITSEFRTTYHPSLMNDASLLKIADYLQTIGAEKYVLQKFRHGKIFQPNLPLPVKNWVQSETLRTLKSCFKKFEVRGENKV